MNQLSDNQATFDHELRRLLIALSGLSDRKVDMFVAHCLQFCSGYIMSGSYGDWSNKLGRLSRSRIGNKSVRITVRSIADNIHDFEFGAIQDENIERCIESYRNLSNAIDLPEPLTTSLYRSVGPEERRLVEESGWVRFPPRLPQQQIFASAIDVEYAAEVAQKWILKESGSAFVTKFNVEFDYISTYPIHTGGGDSRREYHIPDEQFDEFNSRIHGLIEVIQSYEL